MHYGLKDRIKTKPTTRDSDTAATDNSEDRENEPPQQEVLGEKTIQSEAAMRNNRNIDTGTRKRTQRQMKKHPHPSNSKRALPASMMFFPGQTSNRLKIIEISAWYCTHTSHTKVEVLDLKPL